MKNKSFENTHSEVLDYLAKHKFNISAVGKDGNSIKVDDKNFGIKDQNAIEKINPKILISGSSNSFIWYIFMNKYAKGGGIERENAEMVLNNNKQISHHTKELASAVKGKKVPAWVVAKVNRSASDLSDATHYLDGSKYGKGGTMKGFCYTIGGL